jgi:hypothetical protein
VTSTAPVSPSTSFSISVGSTLQVSRSMSAKTGTPPAATTTFTTSAIVYGESTTFWPGRISPFTARWIATRARGARTACGAPSEASDFSSAAQSSPLFQRPVASSRAIVA